MLPLLASQHDRARATLPRGVYDYYLSGSGQQVSASEAVAAWSAHRFRPRVLRDVSSFEGSVDLLGTPFAGPVGLAPTAYQAMAHAAGERASAAAARTAGSLFVLSTRSSLPIEDVAAAAGPWWFQVYVMRDRGLTAALVRRAAAAGARALVLTGDTPLVGLEAAVGAERVVPDDHFSVNVARHLAGGVDVRAAAAQDPAVTMDAIGWLAATSGLPVVVKGVLRGDDAVACLDAGAAGVVVSNHGGRQLDRAVSSAVALPGVVDAVAGRGVVLVDGGIRSGADVLVALAMGADAVLLGRPVLWALAAAGQAGVADLLSAVGADLSRVAALAGVPRLEELDRSFLG